VHTDGPPAWDAAIAALGASQHGVVSRRQLLEAGLSSKAVDHRVRRARLHRVHPGVYAVGHPRVSTRGRWLAAVFAAGPTGVLSHRSAAALWGLTPRVPADADVTLMRTPGTWSGVRGHRVRTLSLWDRAEIDGIPVTSFARTLIDVAPDTSERELDRMLARGDELRVYDGMALARVLGGRRRGVGALRAAVHAFEGTSAEPESRAKSELERRFLSLLADRGFVAPSVNATIDTPWGSYEVDALWPRQRLVIELDGWSTHRDRETFRRDHRRTADVSAAGYRLVRFDWSQIVEHPDEAVARLQRLVPHREPESSSSR
jgi:very-short-patch-repair endonuclease